MNAALRLGCGDYKLLCQDDMHFAHCVDLSDAADLLDQNPDILVVRFGWSHTTFTGSLGRIGNTEFQNVNMHGLYPYADEPFLCRADCPVFGDPDGPYKEYAGSQGASEGDMVRRIAAMPGVRIAATDHPKCFHSGTRSCDPGRWTEEQRKSQ